MSLAALACSATALGLLVSGTGNPVTVHVSETASPKPVSPQQADRKLCETVGPLMADSVRIGKTFVELGLPGTPARDAAIPAFRVSVNNWANHLQPILDTAAPTFLSRSVQRYTDDLQEYAGNINPGQPADYDIAAWNDGTAAMGTAVNVCGAMGIKWWQS